ncbi:hypothetical protein FRZ06_08945 [Anoxybacterium hadale]|uniref:Uncharacterized protein n=2 Tax=Anoxybacterium hadale TaxID=3408580 RepID=A0ACD1AAG4_9FIRM|nr:hypothetical protein FRZ06_08635 [Clostridiales bacterium]QOX63472.1 hypothetical protein FRZ06_08945 [Clostridiales bacterium]
MNNSITEIAELIIRSFEENFEKMLMEKKDISEFVIETKKILDQVGTILAKEALEMMDSLVKGDSRRKQNWYVHEKVHPTPLRPYLVRFIIIERTTSIKPKRNIDIYRMN